MRFGRRLHCTCDMFGHVDMLRVIVLRGVFTFVVVTNMNYETVCASLGCVKMLRDIFGTFKYLSVRVGTFYKASLHSFGRGNMLRVIGLEGVPGQYLFTSAEDHPQRIDNSDKNVTKS